MKKRLVFTLLSVFVIVAAAVARFTLQTNAATATYDLYIQGQQVTGNHLSGEGWTFDPATYTLTLNGANLGTGGKYIDNVIGTTNQYAIIYVGNKVHLTIRSEGSKENVIGDPTYADNPTEGRNVYYGIYSRSSNITITGSAPLMVYGNENAISVSGMSVDHDASVYSSNGFRGVYVHGYTGGISTSGLTLYNNSVLKVCTGHAGINDHGAAIRAGKVKVYGNSTLYAEAERHDETSKTEISAINCTQQLEVSGGKVTAVCISGGKEEADRYYACYGILTPKVQISNGGTVEAYVKNLTRDNYRSSLAIDYVAPGNLNLSFKGAGTIRAGIQMKNPDGSPDYVLKTAQTTVDPSLYFTTSAEGYRPEGFEDFDVFVEQNAYAKEGVYLREQNGVKQWSYWSDFKKIEHYPTSGIKANDIMSKDSMLKIHVLSGEHTVDSYIEGGSAPEIVVKDGSLTLKASADKLSAIAVEKGKVMLNLTGGKTCDAASPITVVRGAEILVGGDGILTGLNIGGNGKVTFTGGTVTGKVADSVNMIVDGGNINVEHSLYNMDRAAQTSDGKIVHGFEYKISSDKEFVSINLIALKGREYGSVGVYPINGKLYVWRESNEKLDFIRASVAEGNSYSLRTYDHQYELTEKATVKTHWRSVYVAAPGQSVSFQPFESAYENASNYRLVWAYSDDGLNWTVIENPSLAWNGTYTHSNIKAEECNRIFRCEIRDLDTNELLDTFTTTLYVLGYSLVADGNFAEGKTETIRMIKDYPNPEGKTKVRYRWSYSKDGGETFHYFLSGDGDVFADADGPAGYYRSQPLPLDITEDMDGWIIRCEAMAMMQAQKSDIVVAYIPITVTNKTVKIDEQPDSAPVLNLWSQNAIGGFAEPLTFSVTARNATKYQWQVARRTAENPDAPFENIGEISPSYSFSTRLREYDPATKDYVYRCVISNEYSEVITNEIRPVVKFPSQFDHESKTISVGKDSGKVTFEVDIKLGNPLAETEVYWVVFLPGENFYTRLSESETLKALFSESFTMTTASDGNEYCIRATLTVKNPTIDLNGTRFECYLWHGGQPDGNLDISGTHKLVVLTTCQEFGHDWAEATCAAPATCKREGCGATTGEPLSHTGGKATCIDLAICELCGEEYGNLDPTTHPDDATDAWNEEDWGDDAGHHSTWSCCGKPKYPYEYHKWNNGVCTVCGCVCNHSLNTPANCHDTARCHTCGIRYGEIDPNNHDLSLGTTVSNDKEATCTEEGYTGDIVCWECLNVIIPGTVIPANGHSDSWKATCKESAYCSTCKEWFGDPDPNNHAEPWSAYYTNVTDTTHEKHWNCCDMVTIIPHDFDDAGVCKFCHYGCAHTGGKATCMRQAECEKCGELYGNLDPDNHEARYYPNEDGTHTQRCGCNFELSLSEPEAHIWEKGVCAICEVSHLDHTESDYWITEEPLLGREGKRYTECTVCHAEIGFALIDAIGFDTVKPGHNCSFGNDLSMLYAILKSTLDGCEDIRLVVEKEQYDGNTPGRIVTKTLYPVECIINGKEYYRFDYNGVSAKEMGDTLTATLVFTRDETEYSGTVDTYSLKAYAMERLAASDDATFKTLLVDLLNYGAAAQTYFGYRTDALVNGELNDEQQALSRQTYHPITVAEGGNAGDYPAEIIGKNVLFGNRIALLVATDFQKNSDLDGVSLRIRYTDLKGQKIEKLIRKAKFLYNSELNSYIAYFDGLKASELRVELELALVKNETEISATMKYSFDTYANNRLADSDDANFKELLKKTLIYSDSAKEYFSKTAD